MATQNYSFELQKNYPSERRFTITRNMKLSFMDEIRELFFGKR